MQLFCNATDDGRRATDSFSAMAKVAAATAIPIAAGERLTTKYEFAQLLNFSAAAILQMNLGRVGELRL